MFQFLKRHIIKAISSLRRGGGRCHFGVVFQVGGESARFLLPVNQYNSQNRLRMPFTLGHPAAIIPFARQRLVLSALVVGSMSPDFLYFINLAPRGQFGHTLAGVFLFCIPLGMLTLWLFHTLMKWPLLSLCPQALQERLMGPAQGFAFRSMSRQLLIVVSILIGAGTHLYAYPSAYSRNWV